LPDQVEAEEGYEESVRVVGIVPPLNAQGTKDLPVDDPNENRQDEEETGHRNPEPTASARDLLTFG
jgi:hypothetical protein